MSGMGLEHEQHTSEFKQALEEVLWHLIQTLNGMGKDTREMIQIIQQLLREKQTKIRENLRIWNF